MLGPHARTTRVLMAMVVPGHIIFIYTINYIKQGMASLTALFVTVYLCAAVLQVRTLTCKEPDVIGSIF